MSLTPPGLPSMKSTIDRVVTGLSGEPTRPRDAHLVLEPVDSRMSVDSNVRIVLGDLPAAEVRTPYQQTWSWSLFGQELFSLTIRGETTTHVTPVVFDARPVRRPPDPESTATP